MKAINTVIIKTSSSCNLGCLYCYATGRNSLTRLENCISQETLEIVIKKSIIAAGNRLEFVWHGGEPMLLGMKFYQDAINLQNKYSTPGIEIINSLQTNATLITPEWVTFFKENSMCPGISLDGPKKIHNSMRMSSYEGSFDRTMKGISYMVEQNLYPNILAVVSKNSLGYEREIFNFFLDNSLQNFDFLPYAEFSNSNEQEPFSITAEEYGHFMINIFDLWMENNDPKIDIRFLRNAMIGMLGGKISLCTMSGVCTDFFAVSANGDVYHCDWFIGQAEDCLGNIIQETFENIMEKPSYIAYVSKVKQEKQECNNCKWFPICNGGCSHHRQILGGFDKPYYFCDARKMIFKHMETHLKLAGNNTIFDR